MPKELNTFTLVVKGEYMDKELAEWLKCKG